jgi:hypothetical protein
MMIGDDEKHLLQKILIPRLQVQVQVNVHNPDGFFLSPSTVMMATLEWLTIILPALLAQRDALTEAPLSKAFSGQSLETYQTAIAAASDRFNRSPFCRTGLTQP